MENKLIVHHNQKKITDILDDRGKIMDCEQEIIIRKKKDLLIISLLHYLCDNQKKYDKKKMFIFLMEKIVLSGFVDIESVHPRYDNYKKQLVDAIRQLIREKIDYPPEYSESLISSSHEKKEMIYRDHRVIRMINKGSYGILFETECSIDLKHYAIKQTPYIMKEGWNNEIMILSELVHPNVIRYYGSSIDRNTIYQNIDDSLYLYIQMDLMDIDLEKLLSMYPIEERKNYVHNIFDQVIDGLQYIHSRNVIHRDMKPSNILIRFDENDDPLIVITDFGCAKKISQLDGMIVIPDNLIASSEAIGTIVYVAPEIQCFETYGFPSDIYSLGIILLRILSDETLNRSLGFDQLISNLNIPIVEQLIKNMINKDPSMRPNIAMIKKLWNDKQIRDIFENNM